MNIKFIPGSVEIQDMVPCPVPSKFLVPKWYKDLGSYNVKKCIPFLDSIIHGYIQKTWCDIYVKKSKDGVLLSQNHEVENFGYRPSTDIKITDNFHSIEFTWKRPWSVKLPDGFSALVTHPLNRLDLPFVTLSGVVDFDKYSHTKIGNIPFFIKKDFEGIIPEGTPMFQIIPLKRESWESEKDLYDSQFWNDNLQKRKTGDRFYKKNIWHKKDFY